MFEERSHGLFNSVTSGGSKTTGSAKCDRWRSTPKMLCVLVARTCVEAFAVSATRRCVTVVCVMDKKVKCFNLSVHFRINTLRRGY
jgi:hypothetical protein